MSSNTQFDALVQVAENTAPGGARDLMGQPMEMGDLVEAVLRELRNQTHGVIHVSAGNVRHFVDYLLAERTPSAQPMDEGDVIELFSQSDGMINGVYVAGIEFVVERAKSLGGLVGGIENCSIGYEVTARSLRSDGTYDPMGQVIIFRQKGQPGNADHPIEAAGRIVRKMVRGFVPA